MAETRSFCLCTVLVATTLMQGGVSAQCKGHAKELSATEEAKTFQSPNFPHDPPHECKWLIKAEDGNIVHLRVRWMHLEDYGRFSCSDGVSLYDESQPAMAERITTFCTDTEQVFSTSGQNMFVHYHSRTLRRFDFTMEYWATEKDDSQIRDYDTAAPTTTVPLIPILVCLLICSTILFCCCCLCRPPKGRPPIRAEFTSPAPLCDSAPLSNHTHHDHLGLVVISTGGNSSTSRTDGIRANSSSAVPLLSAPQPEASNMGRRSLADSPPAYDDLELVVIYTRGNSSTSRTDGTRANSSGAVPLLSAPQSEPSNMGRRSLADSPPAYDAVVTSDINGSEENPQETLTVRLPSYLEAVAMVNMAKNPK